MKLKKLLKIMDMIDYVVIWDNDDDEEPAFEGCVMDVPWYLTEAKIIAPNEADGAVFIANYGVPKDRPAKWKEDTAVMVIHITLP